MIPRFRAATLVAKPRHYFSYAELTAAVAMTSGEGTLWADEVRCLGGEEAARNGDHQPPASKQKAGRSPSDRVGYRLLWRTLDSPGV